MNRVVLFI